MHVITQCWLDSKMCDLFFFCFFFLKRRLLQMGVYNCQLFNNLGLCCFYAQQYDMTLTSFERALALAEHEEETADVWYNLGHVAVVRYFPDTISGMKSWKKFLGIIYPGFVTVFCGSLETYRSQP